MRETFTTDRPVADGSLGRVAQGVDGASFSAVFGKTERQASGRESRRAGIVPSSRPDRLEELYGTTSQSFPIVGQEQWVGRFSKTDKSAQSNPTARVAQS